MLVKFVTRGGNDNAKKRQNAGVSKVRPILFHTSIGQRREDGILRHVAEFSNDCVPEIKAFGRHRRRQESQERNNDPGGVIG